MTKDEELGQIDIERLLVPIPGNNTAGVSLKFVPTPAMDGQIPGLDVYDRAHEYMRESDPTDDQVEPKRSDWKGLVALSESVLMEKSKDLQAAGWWTMGIVKQHGLRGLPSGFRLIRVIHERYWENLFPAIEQTKCGGMTTADCGMRLGRLQELDQKLPHFIKAMPITSSVEGVAYSWADWQSLRRGNEDGTCAELTRFDRAARATSAEQLAGVVGALDSAAEECNLMVAHLSERYEPRDPGDDEGLPPDFAGALEAIRNVRKLAVTILESKGLPVESIPVLVRPPLGGERISENPSTRVLRTRHDAVDRLKEVVLFLSQTEPAHPARFLIERAVRWLNKSFPEIFEELVPDEMTRKHAYEVIGYVSVPVGKAPLRT